MSAKARKAGSRRSKRSQREGGRDKASEPLEEVTETTGEFIAADDDSVNWDLLGEVKPEPTEISDRDALDKRFDTGPDSVPSEDFLRAVEEGKARIRNSVKAGTANRRQTPSAAPSAVNGDRPAPRKQPTVEWAKDRPAASANTASISQRKSKAGTPSLAEVFGLDEEELAGKQAPRKKRGQTRSDSASDPFASGQFSSAGIPGQTDSGSDLKSTFDRLRSVGQSKRRGLILEDKTDFTESLKRLNSKFRKEGKQE